MPRLRLPAEQPTLETERLRLTPYVPEDAKWVSALAGPIEVARWTGLPHPFAVDEAAAWIARHLDGAATGASFGWAVRMRADGTPLGGGSVRLHARFESASIGFWLGRDHWRQGLGHELARCLTEWIFDALGARRVEADCAAENPGSARILVRCGFRQEGRQREAFERDGRAHDLLLFGALRSERS